MMKKSKYLRFFLQQFKHILHINERLLNHSIGVKKREKMGINKIKAINRNKWKEYNLSNLSQYHISLSLSLPRYL